MSTEHRTDRPQTELVLTDATYFTSVEEADAIDNGYPIAYNSEKALAASLETEEEGLTYTIKVSKKYLNKLYNPYGLCRQNGVDILYKHRQNTEFKFTRTTKDIFEQYITFLKTKNHIHFLLAELKQLQYDFPKIEILKWCKGI